MTALCTRNLSCSYSKMIFFLLSLIKHVTQFLKRVPCDKFGKSVQSNLKNIGNAAKVILYWVIPEKIRTPRRMGSFFNPPSHLDFLKHKTPPPVWISKTEDPSSCLDFREKLLG